MSYSFTVPKEEKATEMIPRRILVIKSRHIGDVLLTGPLISTLKQEFPDCLISALVKPETAAVLANHPHLEEVLTFPARQDHESTVAFFIRQLGWWRNLRRRHFDWTINTTEGDRGIIAGFLSGATERIGFLRLDKERLWRKSLLSKVIYQRLGRRHAVVRNLDLLASHSFNNPSYSKVHMDFASTDEQAVDLLLKNQGWDGKRPLVHIHPVARWLFKCWTDDGMAKVIDHLQKKGWAVVVTSGPAVDEMQKVAKILTLSHTSPLNLSGHLTLKQVAALSSRSHFFFGVDTAIMHMAASMDIPVFALFGPSHAFEWGPWPNGWQGMDESPYPLQNGIQSSKPHTIIQKDWDCVPCGRDGCDGSKISDCLMRLESQDIIGMLDRFIDSIQP
jgi:heptosyltransferase III